ncbi:MAG: hypothetical protein ACQEUZ_14695 [Pseudomonadota bacterium]
MEPGSDEILGALRAGEPDGFAALLPPGLQDAGLSFPHDDPAARLEAALSVAALLIERGEPAAAARWAEAAFRFARALLSANEAGALPRTGRRSSTGPCARPSCACAPISPWAAPPAPWRRSPRCWPTPAAGC